MQQYVIIEWPESQMLMEQEWFEDECHLINEEHSIEKYGSSAYFVPIERVKELSK